MLKVCVVIVNYNSGAYLRDCLESLAGINGEVVVVDNNSSDDSLELLEPVGVSFKIVKNATNVGFSQACNIGFRFLDASHYLFLNPDCRMSNEALVRLVDVLNSTPEIGMVGGLLLNPDGTEQFGGRREIPTPKKALIKLLGLSRFFPDSDLRKQPLPKSPVEVPAISGACMLVKREAMDDVGLWDEGYFLHCEDLDWCVRFTQKGWKIMFVPDAKVVHQKGACSKSRPIFVEWHKHKGMMRFYRKFYKNQYPGILMWFVAAGVWFRFLLVTFYYSVLTLTKK